MQVYVGELNESCTTDQLLEFFKKDYDSAFSANIILNKGYGFVKFTDREEARRAIEEMSNQIFQGKRIKVRESLQKSKGKDDRFGNTVQRGRDDRFGGQGSRGRDDRYGGAGRGRDDRYGGAGRGRRSSFDSQDSRGDSPSARRYGGRGGGDRGSRGHNSHHNSRQQYGHPAHLPQQQQMMYVNPYGMAPQAGMVAHGATGAPVQQTGYIGGMGVGQPQSQQQIMAAYALQQQQYMLQQQAYAQASQQVPASSHLASNPYGETNTAAIQQYQQMYQAQMMQNQQTGLNDQTHAYYGSHQKLGEASNATLPGQENWGVQSTDTTHLGKRGAPEDLYSDAYGHDMTNKHLKD